MTKKFFSKVLFVALVVALFGASQVLAAAPNGTMVSSTGPYVIATGTTASAGTITITDSGAEITAASDIWIKLDEVMEVTWLSSVTSVTLGGTAAAKADPNGVTYSGSDRIFILDVTGDFSAGEDITITGLTFQALDDGSVSYAPKFSVDGGSLYKAGDSTTEVEVVEILSTSTSVSNVSPTITATPSDGGSDGGAGTDDTDGNPTAAGSDVTFTATAHDVNSDSYYLAVCTSEAVTAGSEAAPTCDAGAWAVSTVTASDAEASVTYTTTGSETCENTDNEQCVWHAFVCDHGTASVCFPAAGVSDQGFATGTVTFADVPADGDTLTVDSILYEFDTGGACTGTQDVCVDVSADEDGADAAASLVGAEAGTGSTMYNRGAVIYVYADAEGVAGNSIGMVVGTCPNCSVSGATLAGGDDENASPFYVNHAPSIDSITIADSADGTIEPDDIVKFTVAVSDDDTDPAADTMNVYVCSGDSDLGGVTTDFDYELDSCTGGTLLCSELAVADGVGECTDETLVDSPIAHGTYNVVVYVEDNHSYPATGTNAATYDVTDVAPVLLSYTATDIPAPPAGGSDTVDWSATFYDLNGDDDVTGAAGYFFDDTAVDGGCTGDENNCYVVTCSLTDQSASGSGATATGTDVNLGATCQATVYFNANYSTDWEVALEPTDGTGDTLFATSSVNITNPALTGINIVETSIAYGTVAIGGTSGGQETSMGNVGNQVIDVLIEGDTMCTDYSTCSGESISFTQQKWHNTTQDFDWDSAGNTLVDAAAGGVDAAGCTNRSIAVRDDHTSATETNESVFWKIRIPASQAAGSYTGANTFSSAADGTCTGTAY